MFCAIDTIKLALDDGYIKYNLLCCKTFITQVVHLAQYDVLDDNMSSSASSIDIGIEFNKTSPNINS